MNLQALRSFIMIAETQSFAIAADKLKIGQSTISMQVKSLEDELNVQLFDRTARPPRMTAVGVAMIDYSRDILSRIDSMRESAYAESHLSGSLRLGVIPTAAIALLPDAIDTTLKRHPGIRVKIKSELSESLQSRVEDRELDAAIVTAPDDISPSLRSQIILRERLVVASKRGSGLNDVSDITHYPFIRFNRRIGVGQIIDRFMAKRNFSPENFMELDSIESIIAMVERGIGVSIVPELMIGELSGSRVQITPIADEDAFRSLSMLTRVDSSKPRLLQVFLSTLRACGERLFP